MTRRHDPLVPVWVRICLLLLVLILLAGGASAFFLGMPYLLF